MSFKGQTDWLILIIILILVGGLIVGSYAYSYLTNIDIFSLLNNIIFAIIVIVVGGSLALLGVFFGQISVGMGKVFSYLGILIFIFGLFILEFLYIGGIKSSVENPTVSRCESSRSFADGLRNPQESISCLITGYRYVSDYSFWAFTGFWLFSVMIPIFILMTVFYEFVGASNVLQDPKSKKIVGYLLGLIAYRGFFAANILELFNLGTVGIAILALNFIFAGGLISLVNRVLEPASSGATLSMAVKSGEKLRKALRKSCEEAIKACNKTDAATAMQIIDDADPLTGDATHKSYLSAAKAALITSPPNFGSAISKLEKLKSLI